MHFIISEPDVYRTQALAASTRRPAGIRVDMVLKEAALNVSGPGFLGNRLQTGLLIREGIVYEKAANLPEWRLCKFACTVPASSIPVSQPRHPFVDARKAASTGWWLSWTLLLRTV